MISIVCPRLEGRFPTLMIHGGYKTRLFVKVKSDGTNNGNTEVMRMCLGRMKA